MMEFIMLLIFGLLALLLSGHCVESNSGYPQQDIGGEFTKDADIQDAIVAIVKQSQRECPIVFIYDEQMPELSVSHKFMHRMHKHWRIQIIINFSADKLPDFETQYGTTDTTLILQKILHSLYRRFSCYLFIVWLKDPRILYPETSESSDTNPAYRFNPGWRQSDKVILVAHHITKRYKSLISLRFWDFIPKIVGVKRGVKKDANESESEVRFFTVLPFLTNGKRVSKELNSWLVKERRLDSDRELFIDRFRNLHLANIKLGVFWQEPFFIWGTTEDPYLDGLDWRIFKLCQKYLNFTFSLAIVNSTGRLIRHEVVNNTTEVSWTGMMQMISDGKIDVGVGGLTVTSERLSFFDFCRTYYTDSFVFISPHNHNPNSAINTLEQPFDDFVWITLFCTSLVGMITLQIVTILQHKIHDAYFNTDEHFQDSHFEFAGVTAGFILTTICQKPFRLLPKSFSVQCIYYGTSLTIFVLGMAYSSCLISVFLSLKTYPIVDKIENIHRTGLPVSIKRSGGYLDQYMENSPNPFIADLYRKADFVDYFTSIQAINEVVQGKRIHVDSKARVLFTGRYRYGSSVGLKFHVSSDSIVQFANLGWPVQKHWPLMSKFDSIISRAVESGVVEFWMGEFVKGKFGGDELAWKIQSPLNRNLTSKFVGVIDHEDGKEIRTGGFVPLSTKHVSGLVKLYNTGIGIAILVFLVECTFGTLLFLKEKIKIHFLIWWSTRSENKASASVTQTKPTKKAEKSSKTNYKEFPQLVWSDFDNY